MVLLQPWALWGLAAAVIPIWLHLERKRGAKLILLPTTRFLDELQQQRFFSLRVQEWLLLALRLLLVALLVLMAAVPRWEGWSSGAGARTLGILLDISPSTAYRDASGAQRERLLRQAKTLLDAAPIGATIVVGALGGDDSTPPPRAASSAERAYAMLEQMAISGSDTPVVTALDTMLAALSGYGGGALFVVTDLQATAWLSTLEPATAARLRDALLRHGCRLTIAAAPVAKPANLWIDAVDAPVLPRPAGRRLAVSVAISADPAVQAGTGPARVGMSVIDERGAAQEQTVALALRGGLLTGQTTVAFDLEPAPGETVISRQLRVEAQPPPAADPLPQDNTVLLRIPIAAAADVLLVSPENTDLAGKSLRSALAVEQAPEHPRAAPRYNLAAVSRQDLHARHLAGRRLCIMPQDAGLLLSEEQAAWIIDALRGGMGLLWIMGGEASAGGAPLARALGVGAVDVVRERLTARPANAAHPVPRTLAAFPEIAWKDITVQRLLTTELLAAALYEAVSPANVAKPLVVERPYGRGRAILITTGLNAEESSLAAAPQWVALLQETIAYLAAAEQPDAGQTVERYCAPEESRLAPLTSAERAALEKALGCKIASAAMPNSGPLAAGRFYLWPEQVLLLLALACALAETRLANRL